MESLKGLRVLVVDDDPDLRECVAEDFEYYGLIVQKAECGNQALGLIQKNQFDFVFSDMRMPDGDGRFLAREIKKINSNRPMFFLYSGYNDISDSEKIVFGIREIFTKPLESKTMIKKILEHFNNQKS